MTLKLFGSGQTFLTSKILGSQRPELVANTGKGDAGLGRMLGCPPAGSETSMVSGAWAWCAARLRTQLHREESLSVGYSKGDVSVDGRGEM